MKIRARKLLGMGVLTLWMIVYALGAMAIIAQFDRPNVWVEMVLYCVLGFLWIIPLKPLFIWMGRAPDRYNQPDPKRP